MHTIDIMETTSRMDGQMHICTHRWTENKNNSSGSRVIKTKTEIHQTILLLLLLLLQVYNNYNYYYYYYFQLVFNHLTLPKSLQVMPVPKINFWELLEQAYHLHRS